MTEEELDRYKNIARQAIVEALKGISDDLGKGEVDGIAYVILGEKGIKSNLCGGFTPLQLFTLRKALLRLVSECSERLIAAVSALDEPVPDEKAPP